MLHIRPLILNTAVYVWCRKRAPDARLWRAEEPRPIPGVVQRARESVQQHMLAGVKGQELLQKRLFIIPPPEGRTTQSRDRTQRAGSSTKESGRAHRVGVQHNKIQLRMKSIGA